MKRILFLIVIALLCVGCSKSSFMETTILNELNDKEIKNFPAIIIEGDTIVSGEFYYEGIRLGIDGILNKPSNELSYNEKKAIELLDKVTYRDCYELTINVLNYAMNLESLKNLNLTLESCDYSNDQETEELSLSLYKAFENDVNNKIKEESSDLYFLVVETYILFEIVPTHFIIGGGSAQTGYVDLGLPSGTKWKDSNEDYPNLFYTYDEAVSAFGDMLPTKEQFDELKVYCTWEWQNNGGYKVTGTNGNSIVLPAAGYSDCDGDVHLMGSCGFYWSSTPYDSECAWYLGFNSGDVDLGRNYYYDYDYDCYPVRLVQD